MKRQGIVFMLLLLQVLFICCGCGSQSTDQLTAAPQETAAVVTETAVEEAAPEEAALEEALNNGVIAGAGLDVFEEEPTKNTSLVNNAKVSVTPHIGAATDEAQTRIGEEVVSIIKEFFNL